MFKSVVKDRPIEVRDGPAPWFTLPAIAYLDALSLTDFSVFEWGSGLSTVFWSKRARTVVAVEDDKAWFDRVREQHNAANVEFVFETESDDYVNAVNNATFDIIVIDGSHRAACARAAVEHLSDRGFVILDNADWHPAAASSLRSSGLIEVDFAGFSAGNGYTSVTALFLRPGFRPAVSGDHPPVPRGGIGENVLPVA